MQLFTSCSFATDAQDWKLLNMGSSLRDTICSLFIIYAISVALTICCGAIAHHLVIAACSSVETIWLGLSIAKAVRHERRIDSLGARAALVKGWLPFNIDFVVGLLW